MWCEQRREICRSHSYDSCCNCMLTWRSSSRARSPSRRASRRWCAARRGCGSCSCCMDLWCCSMECSHFPECDPSVGSQLGHGTFRGSSRACACPPPCASSDPPCSRAHADSPHPSSRSASSPDSGWRNPSWTVAQTCPSPADTPPSSSEPVRHSSHAPLRPCWTRGTWTTREQPSKVPACRRLQRHH